MPFAPSKLFLILDALQPWRGCSGLLARIGLFHQLEGAGLLAKFAVVAVIR